MSLRRRLALIAGGVTAFAVLSVALLSGLLSARTMYEQVDSELASALEISVDDELATALALTSRATLEKNSPEILIDVYFVEGDVQPAASTTAQVPAGDAVLDQLLAKPGSDVLFETVNTKSGITVRVGVMPLADGAVIRAMRPITDLQASIGTLTAGIAALALLASVVTAVVASVVVGSALQPIMLLTRAAEVIAETKVLDESGLAAATSGRSDELARLSTSFQTVVKALAQSREQQRRLVDDAAHELRTPLTSMRANLDLMSMIEKSDREIKPADRLQMLESMNEEMTELTDLLEELVALASPVPSISDVAEEGRVHLEELADHVVRRFTRRANREINLEATQSIVRGRGPLIERKLYPNVDFYTGVIYKAIGFPTKMFTVLFALGRLPGWIAQWREMIEDPDTRIGRPRQIYVGATERDYQPVAKR